MDSDIAKSYSSYGLVTVERIFGLMGIHLSPDELLAVSRNTNTRYYLLLQVPLRNILNGIIIDQATDYREYAQKMIIDYLISGSANQADDQSKLSNSRFELEEMRTKIMTEGDQFDLLQFDHHKLILDSQKALITLAKPLTKSSMIDNAPADVSFQAIIAPFLEQAQSLTGRIKSFRSYFYDTILKCKDLLNTMPDYFNRFEGDVRHVEALYFDPTLGEDDNQS